MNVSSLICAAIAALWLASYHTLPVRDAGFSPHTVAEVVWTVATFALAGATIARTAAALLGAADALIVGMLLGFFAIVVSATLRIDAANDIYLVLAGAAAAMAGGLMGASGAEYLRNRPQRRAAT